MPPPRFSLRNAGESRRERSMRKLAIAIGLIASRADSRSTRPNVGETIGNTKVPLRTWRVRLLIGAVFTVMTMAMLGSSAGAAAADSPATAAPDRDKTARDA